MTANTPEPRRRRFLVAVMALLAGVGLLSGLALAASPSQAAPGGLGAGAPRTDYNSTDVPQTINDNTTVTSTLLIADVGLVNNLNVINVVISHTLPADLKVELVSPLGTRVVLFNQVCGGDDWNASNTGFRLSDGAVAQIGDTCPPGNGTYRPQNALSAFNGQVITGIWQLVITDQAAEDVGQLQAWGLANPGQGPQPTLTVQPTTTLVPSPSPTTCPITFVDVVPTDYFYAGVQFLFCKGAISGYSDNTFRPYNLTTRSQMAKIVVLGLDVPLFPPPSTPSFSDVPASNPFFTYIETGRLFGIFSGYGDGTFRPYAQVTRGQLVKMVVNANGWTLINPPTARFTDVPVGAPFYAEIETAACYNIISGYSDGTFRPNGPATRGQIAKIVYLSTSAVPCAAVPTPIPFR